MCESQCRFSPDRWEFVFTFRSDSAYVSDVVKSESKPALGLPNSQEIEWIQDGDIKIFKPLMNNIVSISVFFNQENNIMTMACKVCQSISRCFINPPTNSTETTMRAAHMAIETLATG